MEEKLYLDSHRRRDFENHVRENGDFVNKTGYLGNFKTDEGILILSIQSILLSSEQSRR